MPTFFCGTFSIEHSSGVFAMLEGRQDYTMPLSIDFSVAPHNEDFPPDFAAFAYSNLSFEPDYDLLLHQTFEETSPSRQNPCRPQRLFWRPSPALVRQG